MKQAIIITICALLLFGYGAIKKDENKQQDIRNTIQEHVNATGMPLRLQTVDDTIFISGKITNDQWVPINNGILKNFAGKISMEYGTKNYEITDSGLLALVKTIERIS